MDKRVENFLKGTKWIETPMFIYKKEGIVLNKGMYKGYNLSENYKENKYEIIEMLDKISDEGTRHIRTLIDMIKQDLERDAK